MEKERISVHRAKQDMQDFDLLYRQYFPKINNFVYHRVDNDADRQEIVSDVFFKAMKKLNKFNFRQDGSGGFAAWLYRITINEINQYYRSLKRDQKIMRMKILNQVEGTDCSMDFETVKKYLQLLKPADQNLLALKYFEKMSYQELTAIYQKSISALKVKVHRLLCVLRENVYKEIDHERS